MQYQEVAPPEDLAPLVLGYGELIGPREGLTR